MYIGCNFICFHLWEKYQRIRMWTPHNVRNLNNTERSENLMGQMDHFISVVKRINEELKNERKKTVWNNLK